MDAEKRRPERQLYRPPPSRMSVASSSGGPATTTQNSSSSSSNVVSVSSPAITNASTTASKSSSNLTSISGDDKTASAKDATSQVDKAVITTSSSKSSLEPARTVIIPVVINTNPIITSSITSASSTKQSDPLSGSSSAARSKQTSNIAAADTFITSEKTASSCTSASKSPNSSKKNYTEPASSTLSSDQQAKKSSTVSTSTVETGSSSKRPSSKKKEEEDKDAFIFGNWNDILERSSSPEDCGDDEFKSTSNWAAKSVVDDRKSNVENSSSTFKCDSSKSIASSQQQQAAQTFYRRPGRSFRNRNLPATSSSSSTYRGGGGGGGGGSGSASGSGEGRNTFSAGSSSNSFNSSNREVRNHSSNSSSTSSSAFIPTSATFPIGHFVIDEAVQAVSLMHQQQEQMQRQQQQQQSSTSQSSTFGGKVPFTPASSPASFKVGSGNSPATLASYLQSSSATAAGGGKNSGASPATSSLSASITSHYHQQHQQQHSQSSSQGSQQSSQHHYHPQQYYNSSYLTGSLKQQQHQQQQNMFPRTGSGSGSGSSGMPARGTVPSSATGGAPPNSSSNHHSGQHYQQQNQQQFNPNYHYYHQPQPAHPYGQQQASSSYRQQYPNPNPNPNSQQTGSTVYRQGNYTVFRSKWHGSNPSSASVSSMPTYQHLSYAAYNGGGATAQNIEFYRKKHQYGNSGGSEHSQTTHHHHHHQAQQQQPSSAQPLITNALKQPPKGVSQPEEKPPLLATSVSNVAQLSTKAAATTAAESSGHGQVFSISTSATSALPISGEPPSSSRQPSTSSATAAQHQKMPQIIAIPRAGSSSAAAVQNPSASTLSSSATSSIESWSSQATTKQQKALSSSSTQANKSSAVARELYRPPQRQQRQQQQQQPKDGNSRINSSTTANSAGISSSSIPKGGLLRLNTESMKLLLKADERQVEKSLAVAETKPSGSGGSGGSQGGNRNSSSGKPSQPCSLDPNYGRELSRKLAYVISSSRKQNQTSTSTSSTSSFSPALSIEHNDLFIEPLRLKLMSFYQGLLLTDLKSPLAAGALQDIWASCFYPFVDAYRAAVAHYQADNLTVVDSSQAAEVVKSGSGNSRNQVVAAAVAIAQRTQVPLNSTAPDCTTSQSTLTQSCPAGIINLGGSTSGSNNKKSAHHLNQLTALVDEGRRYFESLVEQMCATYDCSLQALVDRRKHYELNQSLYGALQELTYHLKIVYIYLGDLTRYYQCVQPRPNFEQSRSYYLKAHILVPKNAHACSQLAMIAYYQRRHFEALYYFIRSFESETNAAAAAPSSPSSTSSTSSSASSTPSENPTTANSSHNRPSSASSHSGGGGIPSSSRHIHKQMLTVIFDDIRVAYESQLAELVAQHQAVLAKGKNSKNAHHHQRQRSKDYRIEYWIDGRSGAISVCDMYDFYDLAAATSAESNPELLDYYRSQLKNCTLSTFELDKLRRRFIASFLMVHGMLNCRTGNLDRFFDVAKQMLLEFEQLLASGALTSLLLVQLIVVNIYTISNTITEADRAANAAQYSFTHMNAYFIMGAMVEAALQRLIVLFDGFKVKHGHFEADFRARESDKKRKAQAQAQAGVASKRKSSDFDGSKEDSLTKTSVTTITSLDDLFGQPEVTEAEAESEYEEDWRQFYVLLPLVKVWSDWVISTRPRFPPAEMNDIGLRPHNNETIWHVFGRFLTLLNQFKKLPVDFYCEEEQASVNPLAFSAPKCNGTDTKEDEYELVQLPEDRVLEGFRMILNAPESSKYIRLPYLAESAYTYMRIASLQLFGDYLCGVDPPVLWYNGARRTFESRIEVDDVEGSVVPRLKLAAVQEEAFLASLADFKRRLAELGIESEEEEEEESEKDAQKLQTDKPEDGGKIEDKNIETRSVDSNTGEMEEDDEFRDEWEAIEEMNQLGVCSVERRKLLQYRQLVKNCPQSARYFKLMEHLHDKKRRFVIKPRYVLLDTNCLIGNLEAIKRLVAGKLPFTVLIPLIVIHELQSMVSRAQRLAAERASKQAVVTLDCLPEEEKKAERTASLGKKATAILEYLKEVFSLKAAQLRPQSSSSSPDDQLESKDPQQQQTVNIRAVTSKGSLLDTIDFSEDLSDPNALNNDDLVLYSASRLIETLPSDGHTADSLAALLQKSGEKVTASDEFIYREVVLITDDLELRLKALCFEVPVKKLAHFLKWTKALMVADQKSNEEKITTKIETADTST